MFWVLFLMLYAHALFLKVNYPWWYMVWLKKANFIHIHEIVQPSLYKWTPNSSVFFFVQMDWMYKHLANHFSSQDNWFSKIQFFFPPALLDSKATMLTIFCSWPWSCDSSTRPVTDWMRLLKVDTMMDWMFHVKLSSIFIFPQYQACRENVMNWEAMFSSSVVQYSITWMSSTGHRHHDWAPVGVGGRPWWSLSTYCKELENQRKCKHLIQHI